MSELKGAELIDAAIAEINKPKTNSPGAILYVPTAVSDRLKAYSAEAQLREEAVKNAIPFVHPAFKGFFKLTRGLILILARSGHAKSTTLACILAEFLRTQTTGEAIVISNEETSEAVYNRIACVILGYNFKRIYDLTMPQEQLSEVRDLVHKMIPRIDVVNDPKFDMTCLEDVKEVLNYAEKRKVRIALLDYLQTVSYSKKRQDLESFQVSKLLGLYLKEYGKRVGIPVPVFAQLKPDSESPDISSRIQNDKTIYNHAFDVLELIPDFRTHTTRFVVHKNRFGDSQGKELTMKFVDGRYEALDEI